MPRVLAASPRKMFPPPVTIPTWMPWSCTSRISSASAPITLSSMPWRASPARISPLSLRRMRWKRAPKGLLLAEPEAGEAPDLDVLAGLRRGVAHQVADRRLVVANVGLLEQADLGEELLELAGHDLLDDLGGLALPGGLRLQDLALALDPVGRHVLAAHDLGPRRRNLHREVAHQLAELVGARDEIGLAVHLDQHSHAVAGVDVGLDHALAGRA